MINDCWYRGKCKKENDNCPNSCIRYNNMKSLITNSGLPKILQYPKILKAEPIDEEAFDFLFAIKENIHKYVEEGSCLYLWSNKTGNGKTTWVSKLLLAYFNAVWAYNSMECRGLYIYTPTLINQLKTQFLNNISMIELIAKIKNADIVIFDDLGVGNLTDFDINNLLDLIDYRMSNKKSTFFTSNLDIESLSKLFGDRLKSRIINNSIIVELKGRDRRGEVE